MKHMKNKKTNKEENEEREGVNIEPVGPTGVFARSSLMLRTPPEEKTPGSNPTPRKDVQRDATVSPAPQQPEITAETPTCSKSVTYIDQTTQTLLPHDDAAAVHQRFLDADRKMEEGFQKIRTLIISMTTAIQKQPNISSTVKNGLPVLEEALDSMVEAARASIEARNSMISASPTEMNIVKPPGETAAILVTTQKRTASSPLQAKEEKRKKDQTSAISWQKARSKKTKRAAKAIETPNNGEVIHARTAEESKTAMAKIDQISTAPCTTETSPNLVGGQLKKRKPQREALLIKPAQGKSYAEVLREIRAKVNPTDTRTEIRAIRRTRSGEVLVELGREKGDKVAFGEALRRSLGGLATVRSLEPKESVEIRDLDDLTTVDEVTAAVIGATGGLAEHPAVSITKSNSRAQRMAIVTLSAKEARQLAAAQHIKIGWVSCRVRQRLNVPRCFRCLSYGHHANTCNGPNRSHLCFKCMKPDHKSKDCSSPEYCALCAEVSTGQEDPDHVAGSRKCRVFRCALERSKLHTR